MESEIKWVAEQNAARLERSNKRSFILNVILIIILLATNIGWLYYESQFQTTQEMKVEQDIETGEGEGDTIISGIGDINYGKDKADGDGQ